MVSVFDISIHFLTYIKGGGYSQVFFRPDLTEPTKNGAIMEFRSKRRVGKKNPYGKFLF